MRYTGIFKEIAKTFQRGSNLIILEIGVGRAGRSTKAFLKGLNERQVLGKLYSIDNIDFEKRVMKRLGALLIAHWNFLYGDSKKVEWKKEIDVLFIDGDHSYEGVKADYEKYEPFVRKGGLILMHDVTTANKSFGIKKFWKEIPYQKIVLNFDRIGLGIITKK